MNGVITLLGVIIATDFSGAFRGFAYGWLADKWPIGDFPFWHRWYPRWPALYDRAVCHRRVGGEHHHPQTSGRSLGQFQIDSYNGMNRKFGFCTGLITAMVYS